MWSIIIGRVFLGLIFVISAIGKCFDWSGTAEYMAAKGMPIAHVFLAIAVLLQLLGGLSVITGYRQRIGSLLLILFLIPATFIFHAFWAYPPDQQSLQSIMFLKNLSIMGGLMMITGIDHYQQTRLQLEVNRTPSSFVLP